MQARYLIGIDLGTTNTVVAFADLEQGLEKAQPQLFPVEQLVAPGTVAPRSQLPSFRYHPGADELNEADQQLPWFAAPVRGDIDPNIVGTWGRDLGAKVDGRLVASAKSWLCHDGVDRTAAILPWGSSDDDAQSVEKVSPLVASASYLAHVKAAWNCQHPDYPMELQDVVITIPASFDEVARSLTLKAAEMAGYMNVHLIEEPQAVCYDWYARQQDTAAAQLNQCHLVLVCDVGGGTTDLSLIKVYSEDGQLRLDRVAVGEHLMLGGDNLDLALAYQAEQQLGQRRLNAGQFSQLIQQCRQVKETLLAEDAPDSAKATLLGGGAKLIGGARSVEFQRDAVRELAIEGFLPLTPWGEAPKKSTAAVVEFGLPYAADSAISRHLFEFLNMHQSAAKSAFPEQQEGPWLPDGVLFNGGFFGSRLLRERVKTLFQHWSSEYARGETRVLDNDNPDLAVAYGAVAYGLARRGAFIKIGGGVPRHYFLKVESEDSDAQPDLPKAVCLLPKGTEEGTELTLPDAEYTLAVGQPVSFQLLTQSRDGDYQPGQVVTLDTTFKALPPSNVKIAAPGKSEIAVGMACQLTEVGTLALVCVADPQRWQVEFDLRQPLQAKASQGVEAQVSLPEQFPQAQQAVRNCFGGKSAAKHDVRQLRTQLEQALGPRDNWDIATLRALADTLLSSAKRRRRSEHHERIWLHWLGFCLRPGVGAAGDEFRIDAIWDLYEQGLQYPKESRIWAEWWTLWRRIAAGLDKAQQQVLLAAAKPYLDTDNAKNRQLRNEAKVRGKDSMTRLAGSLERIPLPEKQQLGEWLLAGCGTENDAAPNWWALGRVGARELFFGGLDCIVEPATAVGWIQHCLDHDWQSQPEAAQACVQIMRRTNDRGRDINDDLRQEVVQRLQHSRSPERWITLVQERVALEAADTLAMLGDALPAGIRIRSTG